MGTQHYAAKYSSKVDERFALASLTEKAINKDYEFVGVNAVNVFSISTVPLGDYSMAKGANRYGTPAELGDTTQTLTLTQDKAFTFVIDKRNNEDSMGAKDAGRALRREIDEEVIPAVDKYRIAKMAEAAADNAVTPAAITKNNAYEKFLDAQNILLENKVPLTGRIAYVGPNFYKCIKQDTNFIKASDVAQDMLVRGSLGMIDGVNIIPVPSTYFPPESNLEFLITHKVATTSPVKLAEYKTHVDPPGINGTLVEGRVYFDAFVLDQKKKAIVICKNK